MKSSLLSRKTVLVALLLAAVLLLGGCNLVVKDPVVDAAQVILSVNGEEVKKAEFLNYLDNAYQQAQQQQQMMQQFGMQPQPIDQAKLLVDTLDGVAKERLLHQKAHELGLDQFTEEETTALGEKAAADFQGILDQVKQYYFADTKLEGEELTKALTDKAHELGITVDTYLESAKEEKIHDKLHEYAAKDLTITEEQIKTALEEKIAQDKDKFEKDPAAFGTALTGKQPIFYTPAGYRYVRQILVPISEEDKAAIKALEAEVEPLKTALDQAQADLDRFVKLSKGEGLSETDSSFLAEQNKALAEGEAAQLKELLAKAEPSAEELQTIEALKAKLPVAAALEAARTAHQAKQDEVAAKQAEALEHIKAQAEEVLAKAQAEGADFDALVAEYSKDPGQPEQGYPVSQATTSFVASFKEAAMALNKVGDLSPLTPSNFGYHILRYAADIEEGPVTLESVRTTLHDELFKSRQETLYHELEEGWLAAADIKKFPDRLKD